ncbi:MAG: ActS/PrrB/RegB family redox-sensitive histidine kinase [Alphaproteobacteria bacterium]
MSTPQHSDVTLYTPADMRLSRRTAGRLRRSTLVILRWTAIIGQSFALILVALGLGFSFPFWPCVLVIGTSAVINLGVSLRMPLDRRVGDTEAAAQLGFDVLQLAILLWLTGGMSNPFAMLLLAPVVTSATTLSRPVLLSLGLLAAGFSFALLYHSLPLPWSPQGSFVLPFTFTLGLWTALMVGMVFTSLYAWRAAKESRRMSEALAATEAVLAHEQKLAALGGLAAAAAHELGTPLATIQITAKEMARELDPATPLGEDADLLVSQSQRCRDILQQLAVRGDEGDLIHDRMSLDVMLNEAADPFFGLGSELDISVSGEGEEPSLRRQAELLYGMRNFIENAVGFADSSVTIKGTWDDTTLKVSITDDGPGFDAAIIGRLGEPYVSGRGEDEKAGGLGLGFFIAKTLIERTGGLVKFGNHKQGGAFINLTWPRDVLTI